MTIIRIGSQSSHIAIQVNLDGKVVDWMEKVTDKKYKF